MKYTFPYFRFWKSILLILLLCQGSKLSAQITCNFTIQDTAKCAPLIILATATETSASPVTLRQWTLTGPSGFTTVVTPQALNQNFSYVANIPGNYCLKLWSRNFNGDTCSITKCNILVAANPTVNFTFTPTEGCAPLNIQAFCNSTAGTGVIDTLRIDWGCGGTPYVGIGCPATPINKTYVGIPGCCAPTVIIRNSFGCYADSTYSQNKICIIPKPIANFAANVTTVNCATSPLTTTLIADSAGPNMTYTWYINNTMVQTGPNRFLNYTFAIDPNCYDVALKVQHPSAPGCSDSLFRQGYICNRPQPTVSFSQNATTACVRPGVPFTLVLNNTSPGLPSMTWSLSGGTPPQSFTPVQGNTASYTITATGTYTVTATANFGVGCSATQTQQVLTTNQKPTAFFTADDTFSCSIPFTVNFAATPCTGCTYQWTFQSGTPATATGPNASTTYNSFFPNGRHVTLIVTSPNGCKDTLTRLNYIKSRAIAPVIGMNKVKGCAPVCVTFSNNTNLTLMPDPIASVCWAFPNSSISGACQDTIQRCFTTPGCNTVSLTINTTTGCTGTTTLVDTVCAGTPPVCTITATPTSMCFQVEPVTIQMNCVPFSFAIIDWGDGSPLETTYSPTLTHYYQQTGAINTTITAYKDSCAGVPTVIPINVLGPIAAFKDSTSCTAGTNIYLVNQSVDATSYNWTFCNIGSSVAVNPILTTLPACDSCNITLTATSSITGCTNSVSKTTVAPCQGSSFTPTDTTGCVPFTVQYINTSLSKTPGQTRWDWSVPPVNWTAALAGDTINRTWNAPGTYTIAMRNTSNNGCIDTVYGTVRVCKVTANFSPTSVCFPLPTNFTDLSVDTTCGIDTWEWNFGDGNYSADQNPVYSYVNPGQYQVQLKVTNIFGCRDSITKTVNVAPVNINYQIDTIICPGKQGCVTNNSTGANLSFNWNIPGALPQSVFTNASPCYSFVAPGDYPAYIHISSVGQCDFYDTVTIHNRQPIAAGYVSTNYVACPNPPVIIQYYDTSKYTDSTWLWSFGDNSYSIFDTAIHIYSLPGCYEVNLTVTTKDGCSSTAFIDSICIDGPYGDFGFSPPGMCACKDTITFTISTVNSSALTLLYGCNQGFSQVTPITPIGTAVNPTVISFSVPYCITDSCQPQLVFGDTTGCIVYTNGNYAYIDSPVVNFTFNNYGVCVNGTVCFQDLTTYSLPPNISFTTKRIWDFGDGQIDSTSNDPAPCHYYAQPGGYNTKLYIESNYGCFDSIVSLVVVVPEFPIAGFYADDSLVCANAPMCFHDTSWIYPLTGADYWVVDFGDGTIDTFKTKDFCHAYTTGGYYRVTMCVYDSVGCPDCDSSVIIRVIDNPVASAGGDKFVCYGIVTQLNGTGGTTPQWEPAAIFSNPNSYNPTVQLFSDTTVTFIVGDQYGCRDTDYAMLTVAQVLADFTLGNLFCEKAPVCVTDISTGINGTVSNWIYDFGDGFTQQGPDTCHSYLISGVIPITLIATDNHGCKDTVTKTTTILPSPNAVFSLNDTVICSDQTLCATDLSTSISSTITNWYWSFGGVYSTTNPNPSCYLFSPPYNSVYDISLIVVDQSTCRDTAVIQVTLNEVPVANFNWSTSCESDLMPLSSTSQPGDGAIIGCEWLLWMGAPNPVISNDCNTSFQFPAGSYPIRLVVTDVYGCTDTIIKTIMADSVSQLVVYPGDTIICDGNSVAYNVSGVFDNIVWTPNVWISDPYASTVIITPLANISYVISATNGVCAAASDTFSIRVLQQIPIEVMATPDKIVLGLTSNITSQIGAPVDSIVWSPDATLDCHACPNPIARPTETTTYTATIYFSEGGHTCLNTASVTIEVLKVCDNSIVFVPNTFTPNGDGLNDVFMIRGLAATRINYFRVFDRWGKLVFEAVNGVPNDPQWGWHGTDRSGEQLNSAVYVYTYEIECINGDIVQGKGNVTLLR